MSYRQKLTYQRTDSLSNGASGSTKRPAIGDNEFDKTGEGGSTSPVGSAKDTYGYMGFTSGKSK